MGEEPVEETPEKKSEEESEKGSEDAKDKTEVSEPKPSEAS